jgi:predicted butyrate kinase (DUF1464 family)
MSRLTDEREELMRVLGIDPGTGSFDFFGMDGDKTIMDASVAVPRIAENPGVLLDTIRSVLPLDIIVGPSGYGLPLLPIKDMTERDLNMMVPDDKSIPLYDGIRAVIRRMKQENLPVRFTPGAIHLPTIPVYRKANKMDMGTADKVCCAALAISDQAERQGIDYADTSFILAELGYAFTAVMAVENGGVIDGLGGTSGGPGFIASGCIDAELAIRLIEYPGAAIFSGGVKDMSGNASLTPVELATNRDKYADAWEMLIESAAKSVAAMTVPLPRPREILLSGRLIEIPEVLRELKARLTRFAPVHRVGRKAKTAKEAAEGAYIIGEGLLGGRYSGIVECLKLKRADGTMSDYVMIKGISRKPV